MLLPPTEQLSELIKASFPVEPLPRSFWFDAGEHRCGDIPEELAKRLEHRHWVDVTMRDWTMIGPAVIAKAYLHPDAFRYYLPSLLVGVLSDIGYLDCVLECLLPAGRKRRTDRPEWLQFWDGLSETQRDTIRCYLKTVRSMCGEPAGPVVQHLFDEIEAVWGRR
ncbi:hypothetical protein BRAS3843_410030 [Bradyrhizobium sp. STM 3843]|uniref:DUF6714 family protein n=1 Tax=Bradyrhizobium sp. STM 3843 TaxID=551947 RepID=UPI00024036F3|nr:DUF6714 family protein [Bradyrhizobium sp. STM 3843]CCE10201.1 hypothetical protein BRAS3843_410030 [Bradyrhizobium sp. STM 3843]